MTTPSLIWLLIGSGLVTIVASLGVRSLRAFSRHDLEEICRKKDRLDRFGQILRLHEMVAFSAEILVSVSTVVVALAAVLLLEREWSLAAEPGALGFVAKVAVAGLVVAVCVVFFPWIASRVFAERFIAVSWPLWRTLAAVVAPLVWVAKLIDTGTHRLMGRSPQPMDEETFEEEIRTIVTEGHREGLLEEDAREMIEGVIELGDADVARIMTPRTDMKMIQVDAPWDEIVSEVINNGHTRIPAYDADRDDIVGVLYSKDLLPELATGDAASRTPLRDLRRKPLFVPETKPLDNLLQMFQQTRTHMAMVVDEYGGIAGLVTIEDVLEEIVGEIVDEFDSEEEQEIQQIDEQTCEALGRAHVDDINEALGIELPDDGDFDTIGGFVFMELGRVPRSGEEFRWNDSARIEVLEVTKRRIVRVRIQKLDRDQLESA